jgi:aspartate-semialdehyde dehydrogenase
MTYTIAVVGATGNVGRHILSILDERRFPVKKLHAVASARSKGKMISFGDKILEVEALDSFDFSNVDIALFSPGSAVSANFAPKAAKSTVVIDNSSHFRMEKDIPLIVPEVNIAELKNFKKRRIIANPNCAVIQLVAALKPLHDIAKIKRVVVTTLQSVSGAGKASMDELFLQTKGKYMNDNLPPVLFPKTIAFNVIPQIGAFLSNGETAEEDKIANELKKILDPNISVTATCVRIPVFVGHSESVNIEFESPLSAAQARKILEQAPGVTVVDRPKNNAYITPIECVGEDTVYVSRIRQDTTLKNALNLWIVSDNLRKGAALNAVQIAEELVRNYIK